jgi:hypothetical protein
MLYYTILYYTMVHYTTLHHTTLHYTILYYTILYYSMLYYTVLYYTILYYSTLNYTTRYYTILYCSIAFLRRVLRLLVTANVDPSSLIPVTLMMEALRFSETSILQGRRVIKSVQTCECSDLHRADFRRASESSLSSLSR